MAKTLFEKIWERHVVKTLPDGTVLLYIDRHLVHEVTSPQAFEGLRLSKRKVRRPELTFSTLDHNIPTDDPHNIKDPISLAQVQALTQNCKDFGVTLFDFASGNQGIVHTIGPEMGITLPGLTMVCGDSHTSTHGAFGTLAFGIGTSEVEHVMATQTLRQSKPKTFKVEFTGKLQPGASSKDMVLKMIGLIGTAGGTGYVIEYCGEAIRALSMEARMTICNMTIEGGARAGLIAPDETTIQYVSTGNRPYAPKGAALAKAVAYWRTLPSDPDAKFDREMTINAADIAPQVTWGTSPGMVVDVTGTVPDPDQVPGYSRKDVEQALDYMGLKSGMKMTDVRPDTIFIGSCTNARIEDLRKVCKIIKGRKKASSLRVMVVPGSMQVRRQAEAEGLDKIFKDFGAEWRYAGCSMCLAMNPDQLKPGERAASTSNRNFEGRQGKGGRTHLVSPEMAAAAAIEGHFVDIRKWGGRGGGVMGKPSTPILPTPQGVTMEPFSSHRGLIAPLDRSNVDTDAIIPKQFLKSIKRTGFGVSLFFDWRYLPDGKDDPSFVLNEPRYQGASILVVRNNFGCGSSREHAVWAVLQYGFKAVIAPRREIGGAMIPGFADIFRNNCVKNGVLTIELGEAEVEEIFQMVERNKGLEVTVDLDEQRVVLHLPEEMAFHFDIDPVVKKHLRHGLDDIALTLEHVADITSFEQRHDVQLVKK